MRVLDKLGLTDQQRAARATSIGGSDATIIASGDAERIERLRLEKLDRVEPEDLSRVLPVVMGQHTEVLNLDWFEVQTGLTVSDEGASVIAAHAAWRTCTLDGMASDGAIVQAKHVNAWAKDDEVVQKYMAQVHHEMAVCAVNYAYLSVFFGTLKWDVWHIQYDAEYGAKLLELETLFHECMTQNKPWPGAEPPAPPPTPGTLREVDMTGDNAWGAYAADWLDNRDAAKSFEAASKALKGMVEADVGHAFGNGISVKRAKNRALTIREMTE